MKTKKQMREEIKGLISTLPNCEYQKSIITKIGRDYIHFTSLYEGSRPEKIKIEIFYESRSLYNE